MANNNLQAKLNKMLADGIEDVKALGIDLYDIIPEVRITNNKRRIGSAQDMNRAFVKFAGTTQVVAGKTPRFRISISRSECSNDYDIKNVLYHEILHCAPNCQNHQKTWKRHAAAVNKAYGLNVTTTKKEVPADFDASTPVKNADIRQHIGKCFRDGTRTFEFQGFNGRPKNSCDIVDVATGKAYVCPPEYVAQRMSTSPCLFRASSIGAPAPDLPEADTVKSSYEHAIKFIGKKVKNGNRGRKVFTVVGVDRNGGSKAIQLRDEDGSEYTGSLGCAARFVLVG